MEKSLRPSIVLSNLVPVVAYFVKEALSNPATWPGGQSATPVIFSPCTPPLDADELEKEFVHAAETTNQSDYTDIDHGPSPGITEPCEARFKKVLEMYVSVFAHRYKGLLTPE